MDTALQTMIQNMPEKTGKSLEEWKKVLGEKNFEKFSEGVNYLKNEHGVSHGFANTIVSLSQDTGASADDLVAQQYKGKEDLLPIYNKLIALVKTFGPEVVITPKKTTVSIIRKKQFALIKPATKTRIDLGLKLKGIDTTDRLLDSGPFGTMCTHRVQLTSDEQVDDELRAWLEEAFLKAT